MRRVVPLLLWMLLFSAPAFAQETGGSVGGSDFGGSSSSGSSGGSSSSDYSSSDYSSSDYSSSSSSSGGGGTEMSPSEKAACKLTMYLFVIPVVILVLMVAIKDRFSPLNRPNPNISLASDSSTSRIDVSSVALAIDWRARRAIQNQLTELAASADVKTSAGRLRLLCDAAGLLLGSQTSWIYAAVENHEPAAADRAEGAFQRIASDARTRYRKELVRADQAGLHRSEPGDLRARRAEGAGVVVVTLVIAARSRIVDLEDPADAALLRDLLIAMAERTADDLVAIEVVWSPAAEEDRMSTAELETLYPTMKKMDERSIAGRVFCDHCGAPFAAELTTCPNCAAPLETPA